ncbi:hypothetical protein DFH08DRAFT_977545 [Mycena albidolilacea]|uniref:DUF6534 domain-containing protein n=1 Tax=Mycena albidolilacea TaxID=1033008 RepID=A0AAD7E8K5_9AGAR|nr:hypothetical protein DFH08DRAFT_977545 [Mycena albidolilacea]
MASQKTPSVPGDLGPTFVKIFGPVFWGFCVSLVLAGVSILQGYIYFTRYNDKLLIRAVAGLMLVLNLLSTALICQSVYYYILPDYGSLAPLGAVTSEMNVDCLISSAIAFISQMFFLYQLMILAGIHKAFGAAADVVATIAMFIFLKSADTGIRQTSSLLRFLMYLVLNRGLLVTLAQVLTLIVLFTSISHLYWVAVHINTTRLYVNTFFAMLNARTPPESNDGLHISMRGGFTTRSGAVAQIESSFEVAKVSEFGSDGCRVKVHNTSTMADI